MSKIKLQGHASGSGIFTLTSANSNTDRTITLPDGTGTLAFTTGDDDKLPLSGGTMTGTTAHGDNIKSTWGTEPNLEIFHDGSHSRIKDVATGYIKIQSEQVAILNTADSEMMANFVADGAVDLYHNNVKKFATTSAGVAVTGAVNSTGEMRVSNPSATSQLYLYGASGQKSNIILNEYGVRAWHIGAGTETSGQLSIGDGSTERMRFQHGGVVSIPSGIELGSGVDNTANNTLDDYEVGIHVVTATDTGGGATYGLNASYNTFAYTKIGRLVTITGALVNSTVSGTPSGSIALSLPFACVNTTDQGGKSGGAGISYYQVQKYSSGIYPAHSIAEGASVVTLKYGVVGANQYDTKFNTSSQVYCNFSYFTA